MPVYGVDSHVVEMAALLMVTLICRLISELTEYEKMCVLESMKYSNNLMTIKSNSHLGEENQLYIYVPIRGLATYER